MCHMVTGAPGPGPPVRIEQVFGGHVSHGHMSHGEGRPVRADPPCYWLPNRVDFDTLGVVHDVGDEVL